MSLLTRGSKPIGGYQSAVIKTADTDAEVPDTAAPGNSCARNGYHVDFAVRHDHFRVPADRRKQRRDMDDHRHRLHSTARQQHRRDPGRNSSLKTKEKIVNGTQTAVEIVSNAATTHIQVRAAGLFTSGTSMAYMLEGLLAAVALVVGTVATLEKASKEGAGAGMTHQFLVIGLSGTIFLSAGIAALITHEFQSHGITNHANVLNPWGQ
jgi:hypothetical protein